MPETITRSSSVLRVEVRTARKTHVCNDCEKPIEPGDKYEHSATPPHRIQEYDVGRWLTWRCHYPRHDVGGSPPHARFLMGCDVAAAYREKTEREALTYA
jgi:hypothetical protein